MLSKLELTNYKGFEHFTVSLAQKNYLVGPNNAGKSTIISALRLCAVALKHARLKQPTHSYETGDRKIIGYPLAVLAQREASSFVSENVRHELRDEQASLELTFSNEASLTMVWPNGDEEPFFYLDKLPGMNIRSTASVKQKTDEIGIVPTLTPIDHREEVLSEQHIRRNQLSQLTSRRFRNQLHFFKLRSPDKFVEFVKFVLENTPELTDLSLTTAMGDKGQELDLYYGEAGSRTPKELFWAGDGMHIWLQVLFHIFRQGDAKTLVLDEPDVFLHPDLQRRLVGILEEHQNQIVLATHAPEILTEASRGAVVMIDRSRRNSRRIRDDTAMAAVNVKLGSGFNLGMARALRSKVALFVEGDDMKLLRNVAKTIGARRVAAERGVSVIPLRGFTNWQHTESFAWMTRDLLGEAMEIYVVLDRDYRTEEQVFDVTEQLSAAGVRAHVWKKKELESYLIVPAAISRLSGANESDVRNTMVEAAEHLRHSIFSNFAFERGRTAGRKHDVTVVAEALPIFESLWLVDETKLSLAPPKEVLAYVNNWLTSNGGKAISFRALSQRTRRSELDQEMINLIAGIEDLL